MPDPVPPPVVTPPETPPAGTPPPATPPAGSFTQADLDRLVSERLAADRRDRETKAAEEAAKAKGEWEKLASDRERRVKELEGEVARRDHAELQRKAAVKHSLPAELAARLQGATEAELDADAASLAKLVPPSGTPGGAGGGPGNPDRGRAGALTLDAVRRMTPAEINARWDEVSKVMAGQ